MIGLAIFPTMVSMLTVSISTRLTGLTKTSVPGVFEPLTGIPVGSVIRFAAEKNNSSCIIYARFSRFEIFALKINMLAL